MGMMTTLLIALPTAALLAHPIVPLLALMLGAAFVLIAVQGPAIAAGDVVTENLVWVPQLDLELTFRLDAVSWIFALLVTGAGALVLFYCHDYFEEGEDGLARFGSVFLGFAASMLGLVLADNVYLMFVFWEGTTVFSFLLI